MVDAIVGGVLGALALIGIGASASLRVVTEYERAVAFRLGRIRRNVKGPGLIVRWPGVDRLVRVSLRVEVVDIPQQAVITADNVTVQVDAVVYFQVTDPVRAVVGVDNYRFASQRVAMTALRSIIGRHELDNILAHRENVNNELRASIATSTHNWGVEVRQVEIRDIVLTKELLRAMARQAEAERERRAKVIAATGELEASRELSEAASVLQRAPGALQLRTLQTLGEIATENNSTMIFPIPIELLQGLQGFASAVTGANGSAPVVTVPSPAPPSTPEVGAGPEPAGSESTGSESTEPEPDPAATPVPGTTATTGDDGAERTVDVVVDPGEVEGPAPAA